MCSTNVVVGISIGLHARAATAFVQCASQFKSSVWAEHQGVRASAKSLLGVLALGVEQGSEITLTASGTDEDAALEALCQMVGPEPEAAQVPEEGDMDPTDVK